MPQTHPTASASGLPPVPVAVLLPRTAHHPPTTSAASAQSTWCGIDTWNVTSPWNGGTTQHMRVLAPTAPNANYPHAFLIMLPVDPDQDTTFGDSIGTVQGLGAHNAYNLTCVQPGYAPAAGTGPWFGDNPLDPSISRDAKHLYVADYARGIAEVDRLAGTVRWLSHPRSIALNGIDGLVVTGSNTLLAVQNGFIPNRVLEVTFNPTSAVVTSTRVIAQDTITITEPTHGVVVGRDFYFIANGGSGSFNEAGLRKPGVVVRGPVILRVSLPDAHSKPN